MIHRSPFLSPLVSANASIISYLDDIAGFAEQHSWNIDTNKTSALLFRKKNDITFTVYNLSVGINNIVLPLWESQESRAAVWSWFRFIDHLDAIYQYLPITSIRWPSTINYFQIYRWLRKAYSAFTYRSEWRLYFCFLLLLCLFIRLLYGNNK